MSRNLGQTTCYFCSTEVEMVEAPRLVTVEDTGPHYFKFARGRIVAHAVCPMCRAKYLAWVDGTGCSGVDHQYPSPRYDDDGKPVPADLSFRTAYNDEPAPADMPEFAVEVILTYIKTPWARCSQCGKPTRSGRSADPQECVESYRH